jgi:hypothetical protein
MEKMLDEQTKMVETLKSGSVGNTTGYSQYMSAFSRQVVQGLWLTGFKVTGDAAQISLSGGVLDPQLLPIYIQKLGSEQAMQGKSFATLQMQQHKLDVNNKATTARYVEFTMYSTSEAEAKQ